MCVGELFMTPPHLFLPDEPWGMDATWGLRLRDFGKGIIQFSAAKYPLAPKFDEIVLCYAWMRPWFILHLKFAIMKIFLATFNVRARSTYLALLFVDFTSPLEELRQQICKNKSKSQAKIVIRATDEKNFSLYIYRIMTLYSISLCL